MMTVRLPFLSVCVGAAWASFAGPVASDFQVKESPDHTQSFRAQCALSSASARWRLDLINFRAHGNRAKSFGVRSANGGTFGFCELFSFFALEVNGIPSWKLQLDPKRCREYAEGARRGVEFVLNFDGAFVRTRFWMSPDSPLLEGEVHGSARGPTPVTNIVVRIGSIPSFLDRRASGGWRFDGYRRMVRTRTRTIGPFETRRSVDLLPDDAFVLFADCDYDGTDEGKGHGPNAVLLRSEASGRLEIGKEWTVTTVWRPNPRCPFRFALVEFADKRMSNREFEKTLKEMR